jgi:predicted O-methyltransferase YrrM
MYTLGAEKGALLESLVAAAKPRTALEIGTFFGYSAVRTARALPPGGRLLCVEASAANADVARAVLALAGLDSVATVLTGLAAKALPEAAQRLGPGGADFIFIDHCKECYLPDTKQMEDLGLLPPGATLVADNVLVPGAPDFLVRAHARLLRHAILGA